jgi:GT2 family glycosyltransferase
VVPTYCRADTLRDTLKSLFAIDYPPEALELIVVDDGMDAATVGLVDSVPGGPMQIRLLRQQGRGAATARNTGARIATGEVLLFCDDDMIVRADHVKLHLATRAVHADALIGGTRSYSPASLAAFETTPFGRFWTDLERGFSSQPTERRLDESCVEVPIVPSCDLSIRRDTFWRLGGFDERFPFAGAEDQDLSVRARRAGLLLIRNYDITALHNDPRTSLRQICDREETGAHTVVVLSRKFPEYLGNFRYNGPIAPHDNPALVAKKLVKSLLSTPALLAALHLVVDWLERAHLSDRTLSHVYRVMLGLHIFRGYRQGLRGADDINIDRAESHIARLSRSASVQRRRRPQDR